MPIPHGRFVWYDLMTTDSSAAQRFYTQLAGWGTQPWQGPTPYTMWTNSGSPLGGVMKLTDEQRAQGIPSSWLPSVCVRSVDETANEAKRRGGKVHVPPMDIPNVGRYAVIQDPQGAAIAIFTPSGHVPGHSGPPRRGEFSWHELTTTDHARAFDFYSQLFGWKKTTSFDMGPAMGLYQMYGQGGQDYGGMFNKTPDMPMPPNWLCYILVDDVKRATDAVARLGGKVLNGPMQVPGGDWIAQCMDPQGAMFALHAKAPKSEAISAKQPARKAASRKKKAAAKPRSGSRPKAKRAAKRTTKGGKRRGSAKRSPSRRTGPRSKTSGRRTSARKSSRKRKR